MARECGRGMERAASGTETETELMVAVMKCFWGCLTAGLTTGLLAVLVLGQMSIGLSQRPRLGRNK